MKRPRSILCASFSDLKKNNVRKKKKTNLINLLSLYPLLLHIFLPNLRTFVFYFQVQGNQLCEAKKDFGDHLKEFN